MSISYENYAKIRDSKHLKNGTVSKGTGISRSFFSDWKADRFNPKLEKIIKIAEFLECEVKDITGFEITGIEIPHEVPTPALGDDYTELIEIYSSLDDEWKSVFMENAYTLFVHSKLKNRKPCDSKLTP